MTFAFTFALVALCWCGLSAYYFWRYHLRGKLQSIVIALGLLGWPVMVARELHWFPRTPTSVLISIALIIGAWGVYVVLRWESRRPRPFQ